MELVELMAAMLNIPVGVEIYFKLEFSSYISNLIFYVDMYL